MLVAIVKETRDPMSRRPHEKSREGCYLLVKKGSTMIVTYFMFVVFFVLVNRGKAAESLLLRRVPQQTVREGEGGEGKQSRPTHSRQVP